MRRLVAALVGLGLLVACVVALRGSDLGRELRPGAVGPDRWRLSVVFEDALNLAIGAPVKVDGVVAGSVVEIAPADYRARVELAVDDEVELPEGSLFRLRYTTALGELYVDVDPAGHGAPLTDGAVVDGPSASTAPTVEDTLASASLLVNGGSLGQVQTIVAELNDAIDGRVATARGALTQTDEFLRQVLLSTRQIDRVLESMNGAARTLRNRRDTIAAALRDIRPAARALTENTQGLARLLRRSDSLAVTADDLVRRTRSDLTVVVEELGPVLDAVLAEQGRIVPGLDRIKRFAELMDRAAPGDYLNLYFALHVDAVPAEVLDAVSGGGRGAR